MKSSTSLGAVQSPTVNGVKLSRHSLTVEASRLGAIARQVGIRLRHWFRLNGGEDSPSLPDSETLPYFKWYSDAVLGLLREHRERAKLKPGQGGMPLSDEEFERALMHELAELQERRAKAEAIDTSQSGETVDAPKIGARQDGASPAEHVGSTPASDTDLFDFSGEGEK